MGSTTTYDLPPYMRLLKRGVRALVAELGSQRRLADVLTVSDTLVQAWHSEDVRKAIPWERILDERLLAHLPAPARAAFWREVVGRGLAVVATEAEDGNRAADLSLAGKTARASAELVAQLIEAVADGHITRLEGERIIAAVDELLGVLLAIRGRAKDAVRDHVVVEIRKLG